ncbi:permease [Aestuariispira insulae]|nr:permease [Aestuariispira insulae]
MTKLKKVDRVLIAFLLILAALFVLSPDRLMPNLAFVGGNILEIAIFLGLSVLLAASIKASGADRLIGAAFRSHAGKAVLVASLLGAFSPFCSCGVIPLIAALLAAGVPLAPVMAFWLASPVIDPEMMILTGAALGTEFAIAKTFSAIALGLMGGGLVMLIQKAGGFSDPLKNHAISTCGAGAITRDEKPVWRFWLQAERRVAFLREIRSNGWFLLKWLSLAFLLEAIMLDHAPMEAIGEWLTTIGFWSVPLAAVVGVPAYLNGYAAIPLADMLITMGLSPAAALSFMVAGGVTSIPAAIAVQALARWPVFLTYLAVSLLGSMAVGFAYLGWITQLS